MNLEKYLMKSCEVACVVFGGFRRFISDLKDESKKFLLYNQYLTLISHYAKGHPRKALMKAANLLYRQDPKTTASAPSLIKHRPFC